MKRLTTFALLAVLAGCRLSSTNPLDVVPEAAVDPGPYLGTWELVELLGETPAQTIMTVVQQSDDDVTFSLASEEVGTVKLTTIGGEVYASMVSTSGFWDIVKVTLEDQGNTMVLGIMDSNVVEEDVGSGLITGEIVSIDNENHIRLTATGADLRTYIETRPRVFPGRDVRLVKAP